MGFKYKALILWKWDKIFCILKCDEIKRCFILNHIKIPADIEELPTIHFRCFQNFYTCFLSSCSRLNDLKRQCITSVAFLLLLNQFTLIHEHINNIHEISPFQPNTLFFTLLKSWKILWPYNVFLGYRNRTFSKNGFKVYTEIKVDPFSELLKVWRTI